MFTGYFVFTMARVPVLILLLTRRAICQKPKVTYSVIENGYNCSCFVLNLSEFIVEGISAVTS